MSGNDDHNVVCGDVYKNEFLSCPFIEIDILNRSQMAEILQGYDIVINCMGAISNPFNRCFTLNSEGIFTIAEIVKKYEHIKFIQISSVAVYGTSDSVDENSTLSPETNYGTAKAYAEFILSKNIPYDRLAILRLSNLYGPKQSKGIISYLIRSYETDQRLVFNNDGQLIRSYLHVQDCSNIIRSLLKIENLHGSFNISSSDVLNVADLVNKFENFFDIKYDKLFSDVRPWDNITNIVDKKISSLIHLDFQWDLTKFLESYKK